MTHEVADEPLVVLNGFGAFAVGDAGRLANGLVVAHVVDDADETVVEDFVCFVEVIFHARCYGTQGWLWVGAQCVDFGQLVGCQRHCALLRV